MPRVKANYKKARSDAYQARGKGKRQESFSRKVLQVVKAADPDEIKYADVWNTIGTPDSLAANTLKAFLVNGLAQSATETGRVGSRVNNKYCDVTVSLYQASAATNANIRVFLVWDSQTNGAAPALSDLLEQNSVYSRPNINTKGRFKFLRDELTQVNGVNSETSQAIKRWYVPLDKGVTMESHYDGSGSTVASMIKGSLYLCFLADTAVSASMAAGTARSGVDWFTRIAYSDK